jgi:hypothetical protein
MPFKPSTSNEAVKNATGKIWSEWFKLLDAEKAYTLDHTNLAQLVYKKHKVKPWWSQMVANTYEQYKGLRNKYENKDGFEASIGKTIEKPVSQLYQLLSKNKEISITTAHSNKIIRGIWKKNDSRMDIAFYAKGKSKTQVAVQHHKLKNAERVKLAKSHWAQILSNLGSKN